MHTPARRTWLDRTALWGGSEAAHARTLAHPLRWRPTRSSTGRNGSHARTSARLHTHSAGHRTALVLYGADRKPRRHARTHTRPAAPTALRGGSEATHTHARTLLHTRFAGHRTAQRGGSSSATSRAPHPAPRWHVALRDARSRLGSEATYARSALGAVRHLAQASRSHTWGTPAARATAGVMCSDALAVAVAVGRRRRSVPVA